MFVSLKCHNRYYLDVNEKQIFSFHDFCRLRTYVRTYFFPARKGFFVTFIHIFLVWIAGTMLAYFVVDNLEKEIIKYFKYNFLSFVFFYL